ncbi:Flp pilus assembly protein CpaB [Paenibacillus macquariensis]|uniref:Flp pilus assembly protein CpaB n=1 Tax=Paenibacillus macquariensis TaxID=948756 RepID=A0ABY1KEJ8_9BACL|nr:RcpC/CpaB family pilus assembly protein [Paenibacillus macquariensis]OAB30512.1 hypothetical protein PMSM_22735 [Paenibacillus macquariensis subsp. macquariensis]SIR71155.1 Flp pilus assembly protein CpaB [Paenibacillus macquariensis]
MKKTWNKVTRRILIVLGAAIITFSMVFLANSFVKKNTDLVQVVVAKENVSPYQSLKDMVMYRDVVRSEVPEDAIKDVKELEGEWFANDVGFYKASPIMKSGITTSENSKYGETLELKEGERLIGIKVDQAQSAGDYIKPGVLVDAIVYVKSEEGTIVIGPEEDPDLAGLLVLARQNSEGTTPGEDGRSLVPAVAIIETSNKDVRKKLVRYQEEGKIYLSPSGVEK